ncbi:MULTISPECIES: hypothetical protein [Clostridia]|jgi:DNA-directed RNA polymerase subunit L|uniref:hypothetical protein n=1 Tax=Clostridia TaxID=186801 RepID=UPI000E5D72B4|nr:hypothetical protein [Eubacterium sp. AF22-9]RGS31563.1 hypothetical protein DWY02_07545 [Eubacterium sp. AF22-9]HAS06376.1 hypothetical protein [Eubacterium sp.]HCO35631.1 hypothetical protein [Eubacterium sp.]
MTRTYAVKYKSKSKMLTTPELVAQTEEDIKALELVKDAVIKEDGQVVTVEVENEDDFGPVMDRVINIFRRIDDKSEVSYKFGLNRE